ncbi:Protein of unknown function DUF3431 [Penicillium chermesinum]|uniref:Uncharacterized protein n=1 Tax=Penicillium chermesinum TaxID=63820 RepID=A0A9W9P624_9EURO|nr:Protein of unknown function DUF3431 [Penicillium chermesinum]KAJ5238623.1 Protein of unknown function DUF3431 [Penicillium chermesinum]KAJ6164272.1 Protein of unknown function DUF3431 [Penicillium chermesinum]
MNRRSRRTVNQIVIFLVILSFILYINRPQSEDKSFSWTKIRYKTSATNIPEARGACPKLSGSKKPALVVSRVEADGDPSWLDALSKKYHLCVYNVDAAADKTSSTLQVPANRGHEAMAYLTFLIDNYASIPAAGAVFVHGSRWAWHNDAPDYDNAALLSRLDVERALASKGYHNLRCDWSSSTCPASVPAQGSLELRLQSTVEPWSARVASDIALPRALVAIFGGDEFPSTSAYAKAKLQLRRSDAVRAQCCAQFVVSRERIWQHSRDEYIALRQWLLDGASNSDGSVNSRRGARSQSAPPDDRVAGRILSYIWHILFARPGADGEIHLGELNKEACPSAKDCYCVLYGRCDLTCFSPGDCQGQYQVPPNYRLPDDWENTHS